MSDVLHLPGDLTLPRGEKLRRFFPVPGTDFSLPMTIAHGARPGRTLLISAGLHSGEYPGVAATQIVARDLDPAQLTGTVIIFHCINVSGFFAHRDGLVAEDNTNLNAIFPGDPAGTPGERLAAWIAAEWLPRADFIADLHSGGTYEALAPCLFFPAGATRAPALAAALDTHIPWLIASTATTGLYSYANTALGIPGLLLERGSNGLLRPTDIEAYVRDLTSLLRHLGILPGVPEGRAAAHTIFERTTYFASPAAGVWFPAVRPGQRLCEGDRLGELRDFFGETQATYFAEHDGIVFYHADGPAVSVGTNLVAYGRIPEKG